MLRIDFRAKLIADIDFGVLNERVLGTILEVIKLDYLNLLLSVEIKLPFGGTIGVIHESAVQLGLSLSLLHERVHFFLDVLAPVLHNLSLWVIFQVKVQNPRGIFGVG